MKLKTTALLAACGVLVSAAGAFAIPVKDQVKAETSWVKGDKDQGGQTKGSRITTGDTLLVDARLGHASLPKGATKSPGETYLFAQVGAADDKTAATSAPMNLAIVVDKSGSMKGDRIANAMNAAVAAVERMREGDSVTVVSFDTAAEVVVAPTRIAANNRSAIESQIRAIRLGGDTCISCGLEEGARQLSLSSLGSDRINRMILLSDGATNAGVRDMGGLRAIASRMHGRGTTISTIGVDVDFDEKVMAAIANEANGRHYFVANSSALSSVFAQEFDDLLASVAKDAEMAIELAPGVEVAEVFDRTFRREGNKIIVPFGTFSTKQEKTVLVKLRVPTDGDGNQPVADVKLTYRDLVKKADSEASGTLSLAVKSDGTEQKDLDPFVAARLERSRTAQTLTEANRLFEAGRTGEARAKLAERKSALNKVAGPTLAAATAAPRFAAPPRSRPVDKDFRDQEGALAKAEADFAAAPPAAAAPAGGFAQPPTVSGRGKASVRSNQAQASEFGF